MDQISQKQLLDITDLMRYAPTGDNAQHWNFKIKDNTITINHHKELSSHILNEHYYASLLSLGTLIDTAKIASSNTNHEMEVDYFLEDLERSTYAVLTFSPKDSVGELSPLISYITKRETNRRRFQAVPLPEEFFEPFQQQFLKLGINIRSTKTIDQPFLKYLIKCDSYIWKNRKVFTDTAKWIRFNKSEETTKRDGFNLANLNLKKVDGLFIKLLLKSSFLYKFMWPLALKWKTMIDSRSILKNTSNLICFTTTHKNPESLVNIGRAMYHTWLELNKINYGVQPLTVASLLPYIHEQRGEVQGAPPSYLKEFKDARNHYLRNFKLSETETPVWMIRTGKANPLDIEARTIRRELKSYLLS